MIICRIYQSIISSKVDVESGLSGWTQAHLRDCEVCREYYASTKGLAQKLLTGAADQRRTPSPFLHSRIMAAVRLQGDIQAQPARGVLGWAIMAGAACLIGAVMVWWRQTPVSDPRASLPTLTQPAMNVNVPTVAQVDQWTKNLDSPLELETQLVLSDANAALSSLARNFVPEDLLRPSTGNPPH